MSSSFRKRLSHKKGEKPINIFYLDECPSKAAASHGDKHVVKMILETAQLLCTAHRVMDGEQYIEEVNGRNLKRWRLLDRPEQLMYKATHINHPSAQWVRKSDENYWWAWNLLNALCSEYTNRYGKVHKAEREGLVELLADHPQSIGNDGWTPPPQVMPEQYQNACCVTAYRQLYRGKKSHLMAWKNGNIPSWV